MQDRIVDPHQEAVEWVPALGQDAPPDPITHQDRYERDCQQGSGRHRICLGEGQGFEQPSLLGLESKYGSERHGNHQKGEKQRRSHFLGGIADDLPVRFLATVAFEVLVSVFDHDDRRIHHGSYGDRDAAQGHDVRVDALVVHHDEGHQDCDWQRDDHDERRSEMKQEEDADQRDCQAFFEQLFLEGFHRTFDQA